MRLRGVTVQDTTHRHTPLTLAVYRSYLENRQLAELMAAQAVAKASLAGNMSVDVEHAIEVVTDTLHSMKCRIPYLTEGRTIQDELQAERQRGIDEYHAYLKSELGDEGYHEYLKKQLSEEEYQKFTRSRTNG